MAPVPIPAASVCFRCQNPGSSPEKFMLQCCECKRTWHHTCHAPPVPEKDLIEGIRAFNDNHVENIFTMWTCKRCGKKPKAAQSRATSRVVDEHRATSTAPPGPPTGVPPRQPAVAPQKPAAVVPPSRLEVAPMPKHSEPPAPPPLKRDAPPKPSTTASQARLATAAPAPMDVDDDEIGSRSRNGALPMPQRVAETEVQRAPSAQRQPDYSALPVQITTLQPPSRRTSQDNPFAGRLVDTLKDTTSKKSTSSKRTAKAPVPAPAATSSILAPATTPASLPASFGPSQRPGPLASSGRPNAPLLQPTASFASSASLASTTSSRAASLSSLANARPPSADGTVIDLGDRLEEMNVDAPVAGSPPHSVLPASRAARTGVGFDNIITSLRAQPIPRDQGRAVAAPKPPVPGVSLPYEWLSQKKLEAEVKRSKIRNAAPQRRSRKAVATKGRALQPEMVIVGGAVVSV